MAVEPQRRAGLAAFACLIAAQAQSIPPDEIHSRTVPYVPPSQVTLRTEVRAVEVPVVVRDGNRRTVAGLTRGDFKLYDDGKPQTLTGFSAQHFSARSGPIPGDRPATPAKDDPPARFLALCFDDLHLLPTALKAVKDAAARFVMTSLSPGDRVAIVTTSHTQDSAFTADAPALVEQIEKLTAAPQRGAVDLTRCPLIRPYEAYQIANQMDPGNQVLQSKMAECEACYHNPCHEAEITGKATAIWFNTRSATKNTLAVVDSVVDGMAKLPGQRMILLTSSGFLAGTLEADLDALMDKARHAEVVINALDAGGLSFNGSGSMAYDGAAVLASGTGGAFFHNNSNLEEGFRELGVVPENLYLLSFAPTGASDGRFHKLKVQLAAGKHYSVEARLGYTALAAAAAPETPSSRLDSEVSASDTIADFPASFTWQQWAGPPGITMVVHLDIGRLPFKPWQGRHTEKVTFVAVVLDSHGGLVAGKQSELQLSFRDATYEQLAKTGFTTALTIAVPPGRYSVRAVALEGMEGKLAATSDTVEIK